MKLAGTIATSDPAEIAMDRANRSDSGKTNAESAARIAPNQPRVATQPFALKISFSLTS